MNAFNTVLDPVAVAAPEYLPQRKSFSFDAVRTMESLPGGKVVFRLDDGTRLETSMDEPAFWAAAAAMMHPSLVNVRASMDGLGVCIRAVCYDGDHVAVGTRLARFVETFAGRERVRFTIV